MFRLCLSCWIWGWGAGWAAERLFSCVLMVISAIQARLEAASTCWASGRWPSRRRGNAENSRLQAPWPSRALWARNHKATQVRPYEFNHVSLKLPCWVWHCGIVG